METLRDRLPLLAKKADSIWAYNPNQAIWEPIGKDTLAYLVRQQLDQTQYRNWAHFFQVLIHELSEIESFDLDQRYLSLQENQVYDLIEKRVTQRLPGHNFTYSLLVSYNPQADPTELQNYLNSIFSKEEQEKVRRILVQAIVQQQKLGRIYIWSLENNSGITTFFNLIENVLSPIVDYGWDPKRTRVLLIGDGEQAYSEAPTYFVESHGEVKGNIQITPNFQPDPHMHRKICSANNRSALLNWLLN